jgi:flagellar P-ring protein precursor FlgI
MGYEIGRTVKTVLKTHNFTIALLILIPFPPIPMTKTFIPLILFSLLTFHAVAAPLRVENFVRIKGQETTQIRAFGIVSGLNGTGDDVKTYTPLAQAILRQMSRSGLFCSDMKGISSTKNSALVEVFVTIPATGARDGDTLDCTVVSIGGAKSLSSGVLSTTLLSTPLQQDENALPFGMAQGRITIEQTSSPNVGRVVNGCRVLADFMNPYIKDGLITLVIKREHARPNLANIIAESINKNPEFDVLPVLPAQAINSNFVIVSVPTARFADPMDFLAKVLDAEVIDAPLPVPRITINERTGIIAVDENVEVKPTAITYLNFIADVAPALQAGEMEQFPRQFIGVDSDTKFRQMNGETVNNVKLKALMACLDELRATPMEIIEIIKVLQAQGAIVGEVVFID